MCEGGVGVLAGTPTPLARAIRIAAHTSQIGGGTLPPLALQERDGLLQDHHVLLWQAGSREPFFSVGELFASSNCERARNLFFPDESLLASRFSRLP